MRYAKKSQVAELIVSTMHNAVAQPVEPVCEHSYRTADTGWQFSHFRLHMSAGTQGPPIQVPFCWMQQVCVVSVQLPVVKLQQAPFRPHCPLQQASSGRQHWLVPQHVSITGVFWQQWERPSLTGQQCSYGLQQW